MYQSRLREANALDFDDIIMTTVNLLQAFPDVAEHYRRRFRHVLVDEYQDTNHAQYTLVRELVGHRRRRTAGPPSCAWWVTPTSRSTPSAAPPSATSSSSRRTTRTRRTILLEQNYRSTQTILTAANAVIERNENRRPKNLWTEAGRRRRSSPATSPTHEHDEAQFVADEIDRLTDAGDATAGRRRRLLPDQRPVPGLRGGLHPGRAALQGRRRSALLRAQGGPGRPRVPAGAGQPGGHRPAAPHPERAQARHRRARRGHDRRAGAARADHLPAGAAPGRRGVRHGRALGQRRQAVQRADGGAAHGRRVGRRARRPSWKRCWSGRATWPSSRRRPTRRTRPASRTCRNWRRWPWNSSRSATKEEPGTLAEFLEQVALVADSDQIPDEDERAARRASSR